MLTIRPAQWPQDIAALAALDTELVTETLYRPACDELTFHLLEEALLPPLHKRYPFDPASSPETEIALFFARPVASMG